MQRPLKQAYIRQLLSQVLVVFVATFFVAAGLLMAAWSPPGANPPGANRPGYIWNVDGELAPNDQQSPAKINIFNSTFPALKVSGGGAHIIGPLFAAGGVSTFNQTGLSAGDIEATRFCLGEGTNCITGSWANGGYWTLTGSSLYPTQTTYNVGVGLINPVSKLQIVNNVGAGDIDAFSEYQILLYNAGSAQGSYGLGIQGSTMVFNSGANYKFFRAGTNVDLAIINGNVGIGMATQAAERVEVNNTTAGGTARVRITDTDTTQNPELQLQYGSGDEHWGLFANNQDGTHSFNIWSNNGGAGGNRVTILQNGNVGIGTVSPPSSKLEVNGDLEVIGLSTCTATSKKLIADVNGKITCIDDPAGGGPGSGTTNYVTKWTGAGSTLGNSQIFDNGTNVGIGLGAVAPVTKLDVGGGVRTTGVYATGYNVAGLTGVNAEVGVLGASAYFTGYNRTTPGYVDTYLRGANVYLTYGGAVGLMLSSAGNVGIRTNAPVYPLHLSDNASTAILNIDNQAVAELWTGTRLERANVEKWFIGMGGTSGGLGDDLLIRRNNGINDVVIDSATGNVGVGVSIPTNKLDVAGDISASNGLETTGNTGWTNTTWGGGWTMSDATWIRSFGSKSIYQNAGIMRTDGTLQVGPAGTTLNVPNGGNFSYLTSVLFANTAGNVGIGTAAPVAKLDVNGTVKIGSLSADPVTGYPGLMYYNSATGKFRCFENGAWTNCVGAGATNLNSLTDVTLASLVPGNILVYNNSGQWVNAVMGTDATINSAGQLTISANAVALGTDTTGPYVATVASNGDGVLPNPNTITVGVTSSGAAGETANLTLGVTPNSIDGTQLVNFLRLDSPVGGGLTINAPSNQFVNFTESGGTSVLYIDNADKRVGVGTNTIPTEKFQVQDNVAGSVARVRIQDININDNPEIQLQYGPGIYEHWGISSYHNSGAPLNNQNSLNIWSWNGSDPAAGNRVTIRQDGNVGIGANSSVNCGDASPSSKAPCDAVHIQVPAGNPYVGQNGNAGLTIQNLDPNHHARLTLKGPYDRVPVNWDPGGLLSNNNTDWWIQREGVLPIADPASYRNNDFTLAGSTSIGKRIIVVDSLTGNVGINKDDPASTLDVGGSFRANDLVAKGVAPGSGKVLANGYIGTLTVPLGVAPAALCTSSGSNFGLAAGYKILTTCPSSIKFKKNVADLSLGLEAVKKLRPVTFEWKQNSQADIGFIAEEVEKVDPLLVTYNDSKQIEGVKYDKLTAVLVNAIKDQQKQIDELKATVARLEAGSQGTVLGAGVSDVQPTDGLTQTEATTTPEIIAPAPKLNWQERFMNWIDGLF